MALAPTTAQQPDDRDAQQGGPPAWSAELDRLVIEIAAYARGRKAHLAGVTLRVPEGVDAGAVSGALNDQLAARGHALPKVSLVRRPGPFLLVSVEFARPGEPTARSPEQP